MVKHLIFGILFLNLAVNVFGQCTKVYTVNWGDTCISIAKNAGLSFPSFIELNKPIDCMQLKVGQGLCLAKIGFTPYPILSCWYEYQMPMTYESCETIAFKAQTTVDNLKLLNPGLDCSNLQLGQTFCLYSPSVSPVPSTTYAPFSTTTFLTTSIASQCTNYYTVRWGDYCTLIAKNAGLSFPTFIALNKPIDCSALQPGQTLCLARVGFYNFPSYQCLSVYQIPMTLESCETIAAKNSISVSTLKYYNPGLDCSNLQKGQELCLSAAITSQSPSSTSQYPLTTSQLPFSTSQSPLSTSQSSLTTTTKSTTGTIVFTTTKSIITTALTTGTQLVSTTSPATTKIVLTTTAATTSKDGLGYWDPIKNEFVWV